MRLVPSALALALLAVSAHATTHQHYLRSDAQRVESARSFLAAQGHSGVTVRAFRGRLTLGGSLPSGEALQRLESELARVTGASSVHADAPAR